MREKAPCTIEGCDRPQHARGMCQRHYLKQWQDANPDRMREYAHRSYINNRHKRAEYQKRYRLKNRDRYLACNRNHHLKTKFGITLEEYDRLLEEQGGVCLLCDRPQTAGRRFAVDHCHETGNVRGLLCTKCNVAIGLLGDDPVLAERVAGYLVQHGRLYAPGVGDDA